MDAGYGYPGERTQSGISFDFCLRWLQCLQLQPTILQLLTLNYVAGSCKVMDMQTIHPVYDDDMY